MSSASTIRVAIIEDHSMVADALAAALGSVEDIEIVSTLTQPDDIERWIERPSMVDAVLLDLRLADGFDGLTLVPALRRRLPDVKIVVLSAWSDSQSTRDALDAGCDGYLLKEQNITDLVNGLHAVVRDEPAFAPRVTRQFLDLVSQRGNNAQLLTKTENEVLQHLAKGLTSAQIAAEMYLSVNTVRNHAQHILKKMDVRSRGAAVAAAARAGIVRL